MGKNILVVWGGGRPRGNTAQLAESFAKGAVESGHNVELISLAKYNVILIFNRSIDKADR